MLNENPTYHYHYFTFCFLLPVLFQVNNLYESVNKYGLTLDVRLKKIHILVSYCVNLCVISDSLYLLAEIIHGLLICHAGYWLSLIHI